MSSTEPTQFVRANIYDAYGKRTSVSIPLPAFDAYLATCYGSRELLRRHMRAAAASITPRPGLTRSAALRIALDERMQKVRAANSEMYPLTA